MIELFVNDFDDMISDFNYIDLPFFGGPVKVNDDQIKILNENN